jgi:dynactin complex subunit
MPTIKFKKPPKRGNKGKKNRAHGRNKVKCAAYAAAHKHEKSHVRRLCRHMKKYGSTDVVACVALARYEEALRKR